MHINIKGAGPSALRPAGRGAQGGPSPVLINFVGAPAARGGKALYFQILSTPPGLEGRGAEGCKPCIIRSGGRPARGTGRGPEDPRPCSIRSCRRRGGGTANRSVYFTRCGTIIFEYDHQQLSVGIHTSLHYYYQNIDTGIVLFANMKEIKYVQPTKHPQ